MRHWLWGAAPALLAATAQDKVRLEVYSTLEIENLNASFVSQVAMPGVASNIPDYPAGVAESMIKNDFAWASENRALSDAGPRRRNVRRTAMNSKAATGQWNHVLCRPVNTLIRTRNAATTRIAATSRGTLAHQCATTSVHVDGRADGSCLSRSFRAEGLLSPARARRSVVPPVMATR
jgi:hypothetical protein